MFFWYATPFVTSNPYWLKSARSSCQSVQISRREHRALHPLYFHSGCPYRQSRSQGLQENKKPEVVNCMGDLGTGVSDASTTRDWDMRPKQKCVDTKNRKPTKNLWNTWSETAAMFTCTEIAWLLSFELLIFSLTLLMFWTYRYQSLFCFHQVRICNAPSISGRCRRVFWCQE